MLRDVRVKFNINGCHGRRDEEQGLLAFELETFTEQICTPKSGITISSDIIRGWQRHRGRPSAALTLSEIKAAFTARQRRIYDAVKREYEARSSEASS